MTRHVATAAGLALAAMIAFGTLACEQEAPSPQPTPFPTATPDWSEAMGECTDLAKQETEAKFGSEYWGLTSHFTDFERKVEEVGDPYGVPSLLISDWFEEYYERLFGRSPREEPDAWQFYESQHDDCMREKGLEPEDDPLAFLGDWPSGEERFIIECVARLIIEVEAQYGEGSVDYSTAYRNFADNRPRGEDEGVDLVAHEKLYEEITGRSPFVNVDAMASFRAKASGCPQG